MEYEFFKKLLPLHEKRIEEILTESEVNLEEFLDFSQVQLNRFVSNDNDRKAKGITHWILDHTQCIEETKKVQEVVVRMLSRHAGVNERPQMNLIALVYHELNKSIDGVNMDKIASENGWTSKTSGKKLKDRYNELSDKVAFKNASQKYTAKEKQKVKIL